MKECAGREDRTRDRLLTRRYVHPTELVRPASKTFKSMEWMGTFSSETFANRHNSGKFETLIALQNDPRWFLLHSWFSKFSRGRSPHHPTRRDTLGNFGSHPFIQPLCHTTMPPPPHSHTDTKTLLFARHLSMMILDDFVIHGFICSLWAEVPLPSPFSPTLLLLLLLYGYCYVKFPAFFFFFCWKW